MVPLPWPGNADRRPVWHRLRRSLQSGLRSRTLRRGPHPSRQLCGGRADAAVQQRGAARARLGLARIGYPQCALGQLAHGAQRPRQRIQRHGQSARRPGVRRCVWRKDLDERPESSRVRAAGLGHVRHARAQQHQGPGVLEGRSGAVAARVDAATQNLELRWEVFNLFNTFNWGNPNTNLAAGTFGRITSTAGDPRIMQFGIKYGF